MSFLLEQHVVQEEATTIPLARLDIRQVLSNRVTSRGVLMEKVLMRWL